MSEMKPIVLWDAAYGKPVTGDFPRVIMAKPGSVLKVSAGREERARRLFPEMTIVVDDKLGPNEWTITVPT